ncbi:hypothetical protein N7493_002603 [Penicillium malachiteum]|uniref:Uncharacterized protein n=1 Tax=Penicillium malachiteum TaxID=1324776 RepID=A0AAD6HSV8_9EURO|nr:hypothetical protein N7493_002603 [Penicillium malachiteum]
MAPLIYDDYAAETSYSDIADATKCVQERDIAVVGYSYKFPGEAVNDDQFWKLMVEQRCAMKEWPADRMNVSGWHHPDKRRRGQVTSKGACFLDEDVSLFDASFFSLSGDEAAALDPQQRHMLEVTYTALENAGIPMEKAAGSQTSVHVGCFGSDYRLMGLKEIEKTTDYDVLGVSMCMTANRVSWFFDWKGASLNVDTACSSSLVALDMACQGLTNGDADMGIAAGTNLLLSPDMVQLESNVNMLSPDSISYSFDHRANGFSRGEGTGVVVLKRVQDALRDGDTIRAVIRATGSNQDGMTPLGIMQPNASSQTELIQRTYAKAGLSLEPTRFFEAHGTGTPVGDPIECEAISKAFQSSRSVSDPLILGALKSNIGHLEGASGIASLIKSIMVLEKGIIPPNTNFEKPNPRIDLLNIQFPLKAMPWPTPGLRRASVNSFGVGGSNAHVVLDDALNYLHERGLSGNHLTVQMASTPQEALPAQQGQKQESLLLSENSQHLPVPRLLTISAATKATLKDLVQAYKSYFANLSLPEDGLRQFMNDLAHTLNTRRSVLNYKSYWLASSGSDLCNLDQMISTAYATQQSPVLGFVFTGQGAQWAGMGRELLQYPRYLDSIRRCQQVLDSVDCPWSLIAELGALHPGGESQINSPEIAQPANTALQISLIDLLSDLNIHPAAVIGHSSGEIAAAYAIKAISLSDAMRIAYFRGLCAGDLAKRSYQQGAMLAVGLSDSQAQSYINRITNGDASRVLSIACINSPKSVTVSGDAELIDQMCGLLNADRIFSRRLRVPVAYHSAQMLHISEKYRQRLKSFEGQKNPSKAIMISSVTGKRVQAAELAKADYWVANLIAPVQFTKAIFGICTEPGSSLQKKLDCSHRGKPGINALVEIGPHSAMQGPVRDTLDTLAWGNDITYHAVVRRQENSASTFLNAIGSLYTLGAPVDLEKLNRISDNTSQKNQRLLVDSPPYPFNHSTSYWREGRVSKNIRLGNGRIDLLGKPTADWNPLEARWMNHLRVTDLPWVEDHIVNGVLLYPAAGMVAMAIEAAHQVAGSASVSGFELQDLSFERALRIPRDADGIETCFQLCTKTRKGIAEPWMEFRLFSYENEWHENCHGRIRLDCDGPADPVRNDWLESHNEIVTSCSSQLASDSFYSTLRLHGYEFGPTFQTIVNPRYSEEKAAAGVQVFQWPDDQYPQPHVIHPTTLDGIFQLSSVALAKSNKSKMTTALPTSVRRLWVAKESLSGPSAVQLQASASVSPMRSQGHDFDISATDKQQKRVLVQVQGLQTTTVADISKSDQTDTSRLPIYHVERVPDIDLMSSAQVTSYCSSAIPQDPEPIQFFRDVNFIIYKFLDDAVTLLSTAPAGTGSVSTLPHIQRYIEWARLQQEKFQSGELPNGRAEWKELLGDTAYFEAACDRVAAANDSGAMYVHTGRNLLSILQGEKDPLEFLFAGPGDQMQKLYAELNERPACFSPWGRYLQTMVRKNTTMRILEIGAGTGGTTAQMLRAMSTDIQGLSEKDALYATYHYTDISAAFFEKAGERFSQFPRVEYQILDITQDPESQGFEPGSYDLVIAANALHATPSMKQTMLNVRSLLKPGGKLMLFEVTHSDIIVPGFIAGLMEGWWSGVDEGRLWSPALTLSEWDTVLQQSGFHGIQAAFPDYQDAECQQSSIIVAGAAHHAAPRSVLPVSSSKVFCFITDLTLDRQNAFLSQITQALQLRYPKSCFSTISLEDSHLIQNIEEQTLVFLGEMERPILSDMSEKTFSRIQCLLNEARSILWVTAGGGEAMDKPGFGVVDGLARTLRNEKASRRICTLALDMMEGIQAYHVGHILSVLDKALFDQSQSTYEPEFVDIRGVLHVPRLEPAPDSTDALHNISQEYHLSPRLLQDFSSLCLAVDGQGSLPSIYWTGSEDDSDIQLLPDDVIVDNKAASITFPNQPLGLESAGTVVQAGESSGFLAGDRVLAFGSGNLQTRARVKSDRLCHIPRELPFTQAASIPVSFGAMWHSLVEVGRLQSGQSILVHAGSGACGQAAIQIAKHLGADVYSTVSTTDQSQLLTERYGIPSGHIFASQDTYFARGVLRATQGRGVDLVIATSITGEMEFDAEDIQHASWDCLASYGQLIHLNSAPSISPILPPKSAKAVSYTYLDIVSWMNERPDMVKSAIRNVMPLIEAGRLSPGILCQVQDAATIPQTVEAMEQRTSIERQIIDLTIPAYVSTKLDVKIPFTFKSNATYVLAGGLGGIGRVTARWMAENGARNLVLLCRSGAKSTDALDFIDQLQSMGVTVYAPPCDLMDAVSVHRILTDVTTSKDMPPIRGCIQGSMVLRNALFGDLGYEDWRSAVECKGIGSKNLASSLPKDLDFFILLSSLCGIFGNQGQSNYAAGCSYLDSFARHHAAHGRNVVSIDLGVMADDGILVDKTGFLDQVMKNSAWVPISRSRYLSLLSLYCNPSRVNSTPAFAQLLLGLPDTSIPFNGSVMGDILDQPISSRLKLENTFIDQEIQRSGKVNVRGQFCKTDSLQEAKNVVSQALIDKMTHSYRVIPEDMHVDEDATLSTYRIDSLLAVELCNWVSKEFMADITVLEVMGGATLAMVNMLVASRSQLPHPAWS